MKKLLLRISLVVTLIGLTGCTENQRARNLGGTMTINLPAGKKLVTATWKETNLWYLTRASHDGEKPETFIFQEDSSLGLVQGTVIFREH